MTATMRKALIQSAPRAARLMTIGEFEAWAGDRRNVEIFVRPPYHVVPCRCGDLNCHGWRFVEGRFHDE